MERRQSCTTSLFKIKVDREKADTAQEVKDMLSSATTNNRKIQSWSKKYRSGDESYEVDKRNGQPSNVDSD